MPEHFAPLGNKKKVVAFAAAMNIAPLCGAQVASYY